MAKVARVWLFVQMASYLMDHNNIALDNDG